MVHLGTNTGYWNDYVSLYGIPHFVDLIKQAGFNHIRQEFLTTDQRSSWFKTLSVSAHQAGMTFGLQPSARTYPWGVGGRSEMDRQMCRAILNMSNEGTAWTNEVVAAVNYYEADTVDIMNEPVDWSSLISWYSSSWFTTEYSNQSNQADYLNKYMAWVNKTVATVRVARPQCLIVIDPIPFWDSRDIMNNTKHPSYPHPTGSDIAYSLHQYYYLYHAAGVPPPTDRPLWEQYYWSGDTRAKTELYNDMNTRLHGPIINAGCTPYMEELGTDFSNNNWQVFMKDIMDYNRNYGFNVHSFVPYGPYTSERAQPCGLLLDDWEQLSAGGQFVKNYLAGIVPPTDINFSFSKAYQGGAVSLALT